MEKDKKYLEEVLMERHPDGKFTEGDLWSAIAEANGLDYDPSDGDLAEWL